MENLKNALGEELFGQMQAAIDAWNESEDHKEHQIKLADLSEGGYVSKDKYAAMETASAGYKQQLDQITGELTTLKSAKGTDAETKAALDALQQKYEADTAALQEQLSKAQFDGLLGAALAGSHVRSDKAARALLDLDKIKVEDGKLVGFDNQLADLRKNAAFLFEPDQAWGQDHGSDPKAVTGVEAEFAKINPGIKLE